MPIGPWELVILLIIVVVIFGAGRLSQIGGALGKSVREFRSATHDETPTSTTTTAPAAVAAPSAPPVVVPTVACASCGHPNPLGKKFCSDCGAALPSAEAPAAPAPVTCPSCATENPAGQAFCGQCGASLKPTASAA